MNTTTAPAQPPTLDADAQRVELPPSAPKPQIVLDPPPKAHVYVPIPEDIPRRAITSSGLHGLCRVDSGNLVDELDGQLTELLQSVQTLGKKGKMKIELEFTPNGMSKIAVTYDVSIKAPKEKRHAYSLFTTPNGQLVSRDPDQMEMDLRSVEPGKRKVREVAPPPAAREVA